MQRTNQLVLIASFLPFCWLAFLVVHEFGHVVAGWLTGGTVTKVVLHPLSISRTDVSPNPNPSVVVWAGPIAGVLLPLFIWGVFRWRRIPGDYLARFFAGFCLIANGAYIAIGSFERIGDSRQMLRHGSPIWLLWLFGVVTVPAGFWMWHRLGPRFGLGDANGAVDERAAYASLGLLISLLLLMVLFSERF